MNAPVCPHCNVPARLTDGREIYPHRPDLYAKKVWKCEGVGCDARVGCHGTTDKPLGTPANAELRAARMKLHDGMIDPLWMKADETGGYTPENENARKIIRRAARNRVYAFLAFKLGISRKECHTAMFTLDRCREAWRALNGVKYPEIRDWWKAEKNAGGNPVLHERSAA